MATENIIVNVTANAAGLQPTIDLLQKMGVITKKDAEEFKKLSAETTKFNQEIKKTGAEVKRTSDETDRAVKQTGKNFESIRGVFDGLLTRLAAVFAVERIIRFGFESVKVFQQAELNARKLESAVRDIAGESTEAFQALLKQATQLEKISIFSDDDIQAAQIQLTQFGLLSNEIENLLPRILDLASAQGIDLRQATDLVIQGINGQTRALKPLGLEFTNTGDKAANLAIITEKLNKFQGATATVVETSAGKFANLRNQIDNLMERLGQYITSSGVFSLFQRAITALIESFKSLDEIRLENADKELQAAIEAAQVEVAALVAVGNTREAAIQKERKLRDQTLERLRNERSEVAKNKSLSEEQFATEANRIQLLIQRVELELKALQILENQGKVQEKKTKLGLTDEELARRIAEQREIEANLLKEIGDGMAKIQVDYAGITKEQRNLINLTNEWAEALSKGPAALREFKNEITLISNKLAEIPDVLEGRDITFTPILSTDEIERIASDQDLKDLLENIFGDLGWADATAEQLDFIRGKFGEFKKMALDAFMGVFDVIAAGFEANAKQFEEARDRQIQAFDEEAEALELANDRKLISDGQLAREQEALQKRREEAEKQANKRIAEEKRKAFIAQRAASLIQVGINTAESITKTAATLGFPAAAPFIAIAAALGAVQAALIASQPIPKFKKGVIGLQGPGHETSDSIPAMLSRGESVMTASETAKFRPTLEAIRQNRISPELLNKVAVSHKFDPVEARLDPGKLTRSSRKLIPAQAEAIGRAVAKHMKSEAYYNPLR